MVDNALHNPGFTKGIFTLKKKSLNENQLAEI